ncbi:MAG TPA: zf-HC2 domain-containing protein [Candidatus Desulfaltia sp.]|nr:zf-HC2 domain-containing protein [Candidatus Desulfaltia sp.]
MSCLKISDLYDYLEGGLSPEQRNSIEEHLRVCRRCRRAVEERRLIAEAASTLPPFEVPENFPERVMSRLSRSRARNSGWLIALVSVSSLFALISVALIASGRSALEFFASASQTFLESAKNAAVLTAKLAVLVSLTGRTLRSLLEAGTKSLSVLTSFLHPGLQILILVLAMGLVVSLFFGLRKKFSLGD